MKPANQSIRRNLHIYFFYLFLFSIPFQTRKVFLTEYSFYSGEFTEWTTFFLYASDIFLILALIFWVIAILRSKNYQFKNTIFSPFIISVETGIRDLKQKTKYKNKVLLFIQIFFNQAKNFVIFIRKKAKSRWLFLFAFFFWLALNLAINREYFTISIYQGAKLIELFLLAIFVYFNLRRNGAITKSLFILAFSGFFQGVIGISQFILQHSVFTHPFLAKITGESTINPQIPGVAKIIIDGDKIIRAYGTFPHSNILGGFLVFTILITVYLYLEYRKSYLSSCITTQAVDNKTEIANISQYHNIYSTKSQGIARFLFWTSLLSVQFIALILTFSRSAWFGLFIALLTISAFYFYKCNNVSRETIFNKIINNLHGTYSKFIIYSHKYQINKYKTILTKCYDIFISFFVISAKAGIYCCDKLKLYSRSFVSNFKSLWTSHLETALKKDFYFKSTVNSKDLARSHNGFSIIFKWISKKFLCQCHKFFWNDKNIKNVLFALKNKIVSRETIKNVKEPLKNSVFVIPAKAGIQYSTQKMSFKNVILVVFQSLLKRNKSLSKNKNIRNLINNNFLFNKLSTVFQHNFYIQSIVRYKELFTVSIIMVIIIIIYLPFISSRFNVGVYSESFLPNNSAINERIFYNNVSRETISNNFIFGSGVGTFIFQINNYVKLSNINQQLQPWQYQPAHNIYLLIASEIGIVGLALLLLFIMSILYNLLLQNFNIFIKYRQHYIMSLAKKFSSISQKFKLLIFNKNNVSRETMLKNYFSLDKSGSGGVCEKSQDYRLTIKNKIVSRETIDSDLSIYLIAILVAFLFIGLFDHYFWTLQQGRLMFWLVLGIILAMSDCKK